MKDGWNDFVLCEYDVIAPPGTSVENVQQARAVHDHGEWRLHFVCRVEIDVPESGDRAAGIDLGNCKVATVSFGDPAILYPGGALKEDEYWFSKKRAERDDPACRESQRSDRERTARRTHSLQALSKRIVRECVERGLYDCACRVVADADVNGAENIRQKVLTSLATDDGRDRDYGWLAQPAVYLFDRTTGRFTPREQVVGEP